MTRLHSPGNSEAGATEQRATDGTDRSGGSAARPRQAAVAVEAAAPRSDSQRPLSRSAAAAWDAAIVADVGEAIEKDQEEQ